MTVTYATSELREKLSEALGQVRYGDEAVIITHHSHPVAAVVPIEDYWKYTRPTGQVDWTEAYGRSHLFSRACL